jgi:tRNA(Ile)-lysidine synthase
MNLLQSFQESIKKGRLFSTRDRLLVATSGGMDSVVLCELCFQSGYDFLLAHANFQLRGAESQRDETFVRELAEKYGKEGLIKKFETEQFAIQNKVSIQVAARELRYAWFHELLQAGPLAGPTGLPVYILTAHHLDDNIETMLMNFFKGTGIAGLKGMAPKQGRIIRPLLFIKKEELKEFAKSAYLKWVEDSSNASDDYTRNYLRHQVLPAIQKIYPEATSNLADNMDRFRDIEILYRQAVDRNKSNWMKKKGPEFHIPVLRLKKSGACSTMLYEMIKDFHFSSAQVKEAVRLLESESGKYIQSPTHRLIRNREWLILAPLDETIAETILVEKPVDRLAYGGQILRFTLSNRDPARKLEFSGDPKMILLDADKIHYPLLLRKWKPGDYFYPLGMGKKKKIARFLIDNKVSQTEKSKVFVLEMGKKILCLPGLRIDDRFKISDATKKILKIEMGMT